MITGSLVAIVTPMKADGSLDLPGFRKLIDWHVEEGTDGIVVVGTTGESPTVDFDEHKELIRLAVQHSRGRIPITTCRRIRICWSRTCSPRARRSRSARRPGRSPPKECRRRSYRIERFRGTGRRACSSPSSSIRARSAH